MVIIFFDANDEKVYICTEHEKTKVLPMNDPKIMEFIPNDDILYVKDAHFLSKKQFGDWLKGEFQFEVPPETPEVNRFTGFLRDGPIEQQESPKRKRWFLHPTHNGSVHISDIKTEKFPRGLIFNSKWHFISVDDIGEDVLEESNFYKWALGKGKIERVDDDYVKANLHKQKRKISPAEAALNAILIPPHMKAESVADAGGLYPNGEIPEILVEG